MNADDPGVPQVHLTCRVGVAVKEESRLLLEHVVAKGGESVMHAIVPVVVSRQGVVGHEDIHPGKSQQSELHILVGVKVSAPRLVAPGAFPSTKAEAAVWPWISSRLSGQGSSFCSGTNHARSAPAGAGRLDPGVLQVGAGRKIQFRPARFARVGKWGLPRETTIAFQLQTARPIGVTRISWDVPVLTRWRAA